MRLRQTSPPLNKWRKTCYVEKKLPRALARWNLVNDCANHQSRAGTIAYTVTQRSDGRTGDHYRYAHRNSRRGIARQRERDHVGRY